MRLTTLLVLMPNLRHDLEEILKLDGWNVRSALAKYVANLDPNDYTKPRTPAQNNSIHLGCKLIADTLNNAGLDMRKVLKPEIEIPWTTISVKDHLFRPVMKATTSKSSTTELNKLGEIEVVWDTVMRFLGQNHGVEYIPFPSNIADPAPML